MKYIVYSNNKKADGKTFGLYSKEWQNAAYDSLDEAIEYAKRWLGVFSISVPPNWDGSPLDYSGAGDKIEIRKEE